MSLENWFGIPQGSGIGDLYRLSSLGIKAISDRPGVGQSYRVLVANATAGPDDANCDVRADPETQSVDVIMSE